jgi:formylglycine-generating enzyme required for sulfatase activity
MTTTRRCTPIMAADSRRSPSPSSHRDDHRWWLVGLALVVAGCPTDPVGDDDDDDSTLDMDPACAPYSACMVESPAGSFRMGSPEEEVGHGFDEDRHEVTLTRPLLVGLTEVTQADFIARMGYDPSYFPGCLECPVEFLSWHEAAAFANQVSIEEGLPACYECDGSGGLAICQAAGDPYACEGYRLPTEAEWEFVARAGFETAFDGGNDLQPGTAEDCEGELELSAGAILDQLAWYCGNMADGPQPVGSLAVNSLGLADVHGNVWEWCHDLYGEYGGDAEDPSGPAEGNERIYRGGSWDFEPGELRYARRGRYDPGYRDYDIGLRLVRTSP